MLVILFFFVLIVDQITKIIIAANQTNIVVIDKLLSFTYVENTGAAFSFLNDKEWAQTFFIIITVIAVIGFFIFLLKTNKSQKLLKVALVLIISGALGNLIDRISFNFVVDFIYVHFFPATFNLADSALVIGAVLFVIHFLFLDKDAIFKSKKKNNE